MEKRLLHSKSFTIVSREDERSSSQYISMDKESADLMLSSLRDNDTYLAYVTLDRIMDYKDFIRFINDKALAMYGAAYLFRKVIIMRMK